MYEFFKNLPDQLPDEWPASISQLIAAAIVALLVLVIHWSLVRALSTLNKTNKLSRNTYLMLRRLARWVFYPVLILLVLQQFGVVENVWASLTAILAMVAIGFVATWSVLSNIFCSIVLMVARPFEVGDEIEIPSDSLKGEVVDFTLVFTTLRDGDSHLIQVPNNTFFQKAIRRKAGLATRRLDEQVDREGPAK